MKTRCSQVLVTVLWYWASGLHSSKPLFNPCFVLLPILFQMHMIWNYLLSPLAKVLRGRTVPRQNHEVGESRVHSLPSYNDNLNWDSPPSCPRVPTPGPIALNLPYVFQRAQAVPFIQSLFDSLIPCSKDILWLPKRSQAIKVLPPFLLILNSRSATPTTMFYCTWIAHFALFIATSFPCCSFGLSWPHLSSASMEILVIVQGSTHPYILHMPSLITPSLSPLHRVHP